MDLVVCPAPTSAPSVMLASSILTGLWAAAFFLAHHLQGMFLSFPWPEVVSWTGFENRSLLVAQYDLYTYCSHAASFLPTHGCSPSLAQKYAPTGEHSDYSSPDYSPPVWWLRKMINNSGCYLMVFPACTSFRPGLLNPYADSSAHFGF